MKELKLKTVDREPQDGELALIEFWATVGFFWNKKEVLRWELARWHSSDRGGSWHAGNYGRVPKAVIRWTPLAEPCSSQLCRRITEVTK